MIKKFVENLMPIYFIKLHAVFVKILGATVYSKKMHMSFHIGESEVILFDEWYVVNWQDLGWSMLGIILLTSIYEGLKNYRDHLYRNAARLRRTGGKVTRRSLLFSRIHVLQTVVHVIQLIIGYCLMLIFMTYNIWLCIAVAIGAAIGYWIFAWEKSNGDNNDCCL